MFLPPYPVMTPERKKIDIKIKKKKSWLARRRMLTRSPGRILTSVASSSRIPAQETVVAPPHRLLGPSASSGRGPAAACLSPRGSLPAVAPALQRSPELSRSNLPLAFLCLLRPAIRSEAILYAIRERIAFCLTTHQVRHLEDTLVRCIRAQPRYTPEKRKKKKDLHPGNLEPSGDVV
ncbi:hypothetical protein BDV59DRAFT_43818 [Aspergillus ambiguus]|uniref:uncharacterized protein n=1 Tax=Aspergillus ambiguus TaxID=176160 RepID=UPI003CCD67DD